MADVIYSFKTSEDVDVQTKTIVKSVPVPSTTQTTEFTLEQKKNELASAKQAVLDAQARVDDLTKEILDVKKALSIT